MIKNEQHSDSIIKSKIALSRHYRHLQPNLRLMGAYFLLFTLPVSVFFLFNYGRLTTWIAEVVIRIVAIILPAAEIGTRTSEFIPYFGDFTYVTLSSHPPSVMLAVINAAFVILLMIVLLNVRGPLRPLAIYLNFNLTYHLATCGYVILTKGGFPYTLIEYSDLYMKMQIGLWLSFIVISGLIGAVVSHGGRKTALMPLAILSYSFVFGILRYIVFLVFLHKASTIYMTVLFFGFGPFVDFLYLVSIYSIYMSRLTRIYEDRKAGGRWLWA